MGFKKDLRAFYRKNRVLLIVGVISLVVGGLMIGINLWNYETSTSLYTMTPEDASQAQRTVTGSKPFLTTFRLENTEKLDTVNVDIVFEQAQSTSNFRITLNDQVVEQSLSGISSGSVHKLTPEPGVLSRSNRIMIEGTFSVAASARIQTIEVTGYSNVQRYSFLILNIVGLLIALGPVLLIKYRQFQNKAKLEDRFPDFIRDVVEGVRSGMPLPQAIENTEDNDYGYLSSYVSEMSAKINWGIPFETVLTDFAERTGSQIIKRASNTIIQSYNSGGNVEDVLETVGKNIDKIKQLRRERESELYGQVVTGYIVYFIFLGVMVSLINYLVPALTFSGDIPSLGAGMNILGGGGGGGSSVKATIRLYRPIFRNLVVIQSVFSGLVIGKLSEGELKAGAKHVAILLSVGYTIAILFM